MAHLHAHQSRSKSSQKRNHYHKKRSRSSSSSSSDTSTSGSTTTSDSSEQPSPRKKRHRHHHRHHKRRKAEVSTSMRTKLKKLSVSCYPPLPDRYAARIAKGEYLSFDKLLVRKGESSIRKSKQPEKRATGLPSWLEAWNRYVGVVLVTQPSRALEMLQYQALMTAAFSEYPAEACLEYDCRSRQLAAKNKKTKMGPVQG